jgi:hypothetical protein
MNKIRQTNLTVGDFSHAPMTVQLMSFVRRMHTHIHTYNTYTHTYIYYTYIAIIYVCVNVFIHSSYSDRPLYGITHTVQLALSHSPPLKSRVGPPIDIASYKHACYANKY